MMKQIANKYLILSTILLAALTCAASVGLFICNTADNYVTPFLVTVIFQLVACLSFGLAWRWVAQSSQNSLPTYYLSASGLRMFAGIVVVLGFLFISDDKTQIRFFVITFLLYYFIFLIFDTIYFIRVEKRMPKHI